MTVSRTAGITRRTFMQALSATGLAAVGLGTTGCVTGGSDSESGGSGTLTLQSSLVDPNSKGAMQKLVDLYNERGGEASLNTVAADTFNAQLPTYLDSDNPPDVMVYFAGTITQRYGDRDKLLDLSELWADELSHYPDSLRELSTDSKGRQIFVPTNYYWWGVFYRRSVFDQLGATVPTTWADYLALCEHIQAQGMAPIITGAGRDPWPLVAWFDYLNLRINGAQFHRALLAGEHRFDGPEVKAVFAELAKVVPYFHPSSRSYAYQEAITPFAQGEAAMYLMGALITDVLPDDVEDLDFFQFPVLDPSVPVAEEAPSNGYLAPARVRDPDATREFLAFLASDEAQVIYCRDSQSSSVPTSPTADTSWTSDLVRKGLELMGSAEDLTQFFNRDSSEELQQTAYTACTRFLNDPGDVDTILAEWQSAAEPIWQG